MRYWKRTDKDGNITTVESYSHDLDIKGAIEIDKTEFDTYIAPLPPPAIVPKRDILAEIDELKDRVMALEP